MERNKYLLASCLSIIEKSLGWGSSSGWSNADFENLGESIWEKTGVRLSLSTLRRIWGKVRYENYPNASTLNALAQYLGHADWRSFCRDQAVEPAVGANGGASGNEGEISFALPKKNGIKRWMSWAVVIVLFVVAAELMLALRRHDPGKKGFHYNFALTARKVTDDLPNSVIFSYDAGPARGQKVMIQQSWDSTRRELVDPEGKEHASIYFYPGYFLAKLTINDSVVKETPVYIQTKGWKGIAEQEALPVYFNDGEIWKGSSLAVTTGQMAKALGTGTFNNRWLQFADIREFPGIDGDNFSFETALRNTTTVEDCLCRKVRIILLGTNAPVILPLAATGCVADIYAYLGDTLLVGKNRDMSAFGCDIGNLQHLACEVKGERMNLLLNNRMILSLPHKKSIGRLVGIRVLFEGSGEIEQMSISSPAGSHFDLIKKG